MVAEPDAAPTGVAQLAEPPAAPVAAPTDVGSALPGTSRPIITADVEQVFLVSDAPQPNYRGGILAELSMHYTHRYADLDVWLQPTLVAQLPSGKQRPLWDRATWHREGELRLVGEPTEGARFSRLERDDLDDAGIKALKKQLVEHLYRSETMPVFYCRPLKLWSRYGEGRAQLAARAQMQLREERDADVEKLRRKYAPQIDKLTERIRKAEQRVARERSQTSYQAFDTAVSVGSTVVGALFGGRSAFGGTRTAIRSAGRVARERGDVNRAEDDVAVLKSKLYELQDAFDADVEALRAQPLDVPIEDKSVRPKKGDISISRFAILWLP